MRMRQLHTFPNRKLVNLDVFSCKAFDHERALRDVTALFNFDSVDTWKLERGLEYLDARRASAAERSLPVERSAGALPD